MQKRRPKRREGTATQAGGDNLLRPLTTLELGYLHTVPPVFGCSWRSIGYQICVILEWSLHAAFIDDEIWGDTIEPARIHIVFFRGREHCL